MKKTTSRRKINTRRRKHIRKKQTKRFQRKYTYKQSRRNLRKRKQRRKTVRKVGGGNNPETFMSKSKRYFTKVKSHIQTRFYRGARVWNRKPDKFIEFLESRASVDFSLKFLDELKPGDVFKHEGGYLMVVFVGNIKEIPKLGYLLWDKTPFIFPLTTDTRDDAIEHIHNYKMDEQGKAVKSVKINGSYGNLFKMVSSANMAKEATVSIAKYNQNENRIITDEQGYVKLQRIKLVDLCKMAKVDQKDKTPLEPLLKLLDGTQLSDGTIGYPKFKYEAGDTISCNNVYYSCIPHQPHQISESLDDGDLKNDPSLVHPPVPHSFSAKTTNLIYGGGQKVPITFDHDGRGVLTYESKLFDSIFTRNTATTIRSESIGRIQILDKFRRGGVGAKRGALDFSGYKCTVKTTCDPNTVYYTGNFDHELNVPLIWLIGTEMDGETIIPIYRILPTGTLLIPMQDYTDRVVYEIELVSNDEFSGKVFAGALAGEIGATGVALNIGVGMAGATIATTGALMLAPAMGGLAGAVVGSAAAARGVIKSHGFKTNRELYELKGGGPKKGGSPKKITITVWFNKDFIKRYILKRKTCYIQSKANRYVGQKRDTLDSLLCKELYSNMYKNLHGNYPSTQVESNQSSEGIQVVEGKAVEDELATPVVMETMHPEEPAPMVMGTMHTGEPALAEEGRAQQSEESALADKKVYNDIKGWLVNKKLEDSPKFPITSLHVINYFMESGIPEEEWISKLESMEEAETLQGFIEKVNAEQTPSE